MSNGLINFRDSTLLDSVSKKAGSKGIPDCENVTREIYNELLLLSQSKLPKGNLINHFQQSNSVLKNTMYRDIVFILQCFFETPAPSEFHGLVVLVFTTMHPLDSKFRFKALCANCRAKNHGN